MRNVAVTACLATAVWFAASAIPTPAHSAEIDQGQWYVSPLATWVFKEDKERVTNNGFGLHLGLGRALENNWMIEVAAIGDILDGSGLDEVSQYGVAVDFLKKIDSDWAYQPYLLFGTGVMRSDVKEGRTPPLVKLEDDTGVIASLGLGLMRDVGNSKFRAELRYRGDFQDEDYHDFLLNFGFLFPIGEGGTPPVIDSDGDGVSDGADLCPGTPMGASVNASGCELDADGDGVVNSKDRCPSTRAGARVDSNGCEVVKDSDGDGVPDNRDRCANTPRGKKVDANGCAIIGDADGDGVLDNRDRCAGTARGVRVDVNGCEIKAEIKLPGVSFEINSATLTPGSLAVLNDAAATLQKNADIVAVAEGHSDATGDDAYNLSLSQRRAEAVRDYLISKGVDPGRLTARGFGETQPVADNSTAIGRQKNRRVTLRVTN